MRQGGDTGTLLFADRSLILFVLLLVLLLGGIQGPKFVVPLRFQRIGYQPVRRVDVQVASLRQVSFIAGSLHLLFTQTVHLLPAGLHLLLDGECDFQRQGSDGVDEKLADGLVQLLPEDMLAYRNDMLGAVTLAHILRHDPGLSCVIPDGHPAATDAADHQALQQRWPFAGWTLSAIVAVGVSILLESLPVVLILSPGDVTRMNIGEQDPLFPRRLGVRSSAVHFAASAVSAINECPRIARVVQDVQRPAMRQFCPHQFALVRSRPQPPRKQKFFLTEGLDDGTGGTAAAECVEQE